MEQTGSYHFEIHNLAMQFMAAFDGAIINRYNTGRAVSDQIKVTYKYGPKQRVLYDLIDKEKHIQIPVVSVQLNSVSRDVSRAFNKLYGHYEHIGQDNENLTNVSNWLPQPVPVNLGLDMSIIARYQSDMDQILSNFIPYTDPYIVISQKIPSGFVTNDTDTEVRTHILWDEQISLDYPIDLAKDAPYRLIASTSFVMEGWLWRSAPSSQTQNILYVDTTLIPVTSVEIID